MSRTGEGSQAYITSATSGWALRSLIQLKITDLACWTSCSLVSPACLSSSISGQPSVCRGLFFGKTHTFVRRGEKDNSKTQISCTSLLSRTEAHCQMKVLHRGVGQMSSCFQMYSRTADLCRSKTEDKDLVLNLFVDGSQPEALRSHSQAFTWQTRWRSRASSAINSWSSSRDSTFSFCALLCDSCEEMKIFKHDLKRTTLPFWKVFWWALIKNARAGALLPSAPTSSSPHTLALCC